MDATLTLLKRFFQNQKDGLTPHFKMDELVTLISYFLEKKDTVNLEKTIDIACALYPDNIDLNIILCETLVRAESFEIALIQLEELDMQGNKKADMLRLECYDKLEKYDEAIAFIDKLIDEKYDYLVDAITYVACMLNNIRSVHEKANHFIHRGLSLFPDNMILKVELCVNLHIRGFHKEAIDMCRQLSKEYPFSIEIWYLLSSLSYECGDYENSIESIDYALTCFTKKNISGLIYELLFMKGLCLFKNGSYIKSIQTYEELFPFKEFDKTTVFPHLAECYMRVGNFEAAYVLLKAIINNKEKENEVTLYSNFLYCCISTGRRKEAIDILYKALKHYPHEILEDLFALNYLLSFEKEKHFENEAFISSSELVRKFLTNNTHYN